MDANTEVDVQLHIDFLKSPESWPHFPLCPVKRYEQEDKPPRTGVVLSSQPNTVVGLNVFLVSREKFKTAERWEYDSVEAVVADGWLID